MGESSFHNVLFFKDIHLIHLQGDFSGCRGMPVSRRNKKCLPHKVSGNDLSAKLFLRHIAERCFYCWSSVCSCNNDAERILLHVFLQGHDSSGSSQGKSL
uniref:Uncharacterized protein LOC103341483 n=1 Tax=Rhizophora mucronata TaxID=61149 RepID=A0A2P2P7P0_RHIMU